MADIVNVASTGERFGLFWNSANGDRKYDADSMSKWLKKFFTTGVFEGDFQVLAKQGMQITVTGGYANINGKVFFADENTDLTLDASNTTYSRIDAIVMTCDYVERKIYIEVVKGQYAGDFPIAVAPIRDNEKYQIVLAHVLVGSGVFEITQADIVDKRQDTALCGYITGTVEEMDFSQFVAQFQSYYDQFKSTNMADFTAWFANIRNVLSGDVAGNLQNEIDALAENLNASGINYNNTSSGLTASKVQGAIDEVNQKVNNANNNFQLANELLTNDIQNVANQLDIDGEKIYMDKKNGKYGYNTSPTRGADTFHPFNQLPNTLTMNFSGSTQGNYGQAYITSRIPNEILESYKYVTLNISNGTTWQRVFSSDRTRYAELPRNTKTVLSTYSSLMTGGSLYFDVSGNTTSLGYDLVFSRT